MKYAVALFSILLISGCLSNKPISKTDAPSLSMEGVYGITSGEASYTINEVLYGDPKTVVGKTENIAGEAFIDPKDTSKTRIGTIRINARSLVTDNEKRDNAVRRFVLQSERDEFEFIELVPTSIDGLREKIVSGVAYDFKLKGNLTIKGVTKEAEFSGKLTLSGRLDANASAKIKRSDFGIQIPNVPFVASVGDDVILSVSLSASQK